MTLPARVVHNEFDLQEIAEGSERPIELIERDFALVTLAAHLTDRFPGQLCFKGGFVLRHVRGSGRLSGDIDATRTNPAKHKLDAQEVAEVIRHAGDEPLLRFDPGGPHLDGKESLDFDQVRFHTERTEGQLAVEVSNRGDVVEEPDSVMVGPPYYEPFAIPVSTLEESTAEKLRTLIQRLRATDLSDIALILDRYGEQLDRERVKQLAVVKFELVKQGDRRGRLEANIDALKGEYEQTLRGLDPDAPPYEEAKARAPAAREPNALARAATVRRRRSARARGSLQARRRSRGTEAVPGRLAH
jgi:predicted nucleotidyltransferase component of viral defense system